MRRKSKRSRQRNTTAWLVAAGMAVLGLALAGWWLAAGGAAGNAGAEPISRLSTRDFHSLAFSPSDPDTIFFGHHGGLLVSRNGGRDWAPTALQNADAMALAAPPADSQILYAAGHDVFFKSIDGGASWQPVATNLPGTDIHGFAADPENANVVFAHVLGHGIFGSQDGGSTWTLLSADVPSSTFNLAVGENAQTLFGAAGQAGLLRSSDGGSTWASVASLPGAGAPEAGAIAVVYDRSSGKLLVTTLGAGAGLYSSMDGGATWQPLGLNGTFLAVAINPNDPDHLIAVDEQGRVYASHDGGLTWPEQ